MVIYQSIPVPIRTKCWHIHKIGKILHRDFTKDFGDVPVTRFNSITGKVEAVDNLRGRAYVARKRLKYQKVKSKE